jgi:Rubrerythrin.
MKFMAYLSNKIDEEMLDAKCYLYKAEAMKATDSNSADILKNIADQELNHASMLHQLAVNFYTQTKSSGRSLPEDMLAKYNALHEHFIDDYNDLKVMFNNYSKF